MNKTSQIRGLSPKPEIILGMRSACLIVTIQSSLYVAATDIFGFHKVFSIAQVISNV